MRILLIEDERDLSRALVTILQHNHYSVDAVYDGKDAMEYLATGLYDCAILDIMLPMVDGLSVLKEIRKRGNPVPVIMLTAKSEIEDRVAALDAGADDYLTKPFSSRELVARIRAITRRQSTPTDSVLTFHDLTLNRIDFTLSTPSGSVRLGNKEFQIMEMLMIRPGQVISTEHFMDKIWGYGSNTELNVVWVYLSYLRKKIANLNANVCIKANRNLGYVLEAKE